MSTVSNQRSRPKLTEIPGEWLKAATLLVDLRDDLPLDDDEWEVIAAWLHGTTFDARSCLAGEVAAGLIRDHAPMHIKDQILEEDPADEWRERFQRAIVSPFRPFQPVDDARLESASMLRKAIEHIRSNQSRDFD